MSRPGTCGKWLTKKRSGGRCVMRRSHMGDCVDSDERAKRRAEMCIGRKQRNK